MIYSKTLGDVIRAAQVIFFEFLELNYRNKEPRTYILGHEALAFTLI